MQHTDNDQSTEAALRAEAVAHVQSKVELSRFTGKVAKIDIGNGETVIVPHHIFDVQVMHDPEAGVYVAVCDELGLVTEAETKEALTEAAMALVPELIQENHVGRPGEHYCVEFTEHLPA